MRLKEFKYLRSAISASDEMEVELSWNLNERARGFELPVEKQRFVHSYDSWGGMVRRKGIREVLRANVSGKNMSLDIRERCGDISSLLERVEHKDNWLKKI